MAKVKTEVDTRPTRLEIRLGDPGMTPLLRAGLGGLAAALAAFGPHAALPGTWSVTQESVTLDWGTPGAAGPFMEALFREGFRLSRTHGLIDLPGAWTELLDPALQGGLQDALRQTILQHGKLATRAGPPTPYTFEADGEATQTTLQRYGKYVQQEIAAEIGAQLDRPAHKQSPIRLAGWAQPGAIQRHVAHPGSAMEYTPAQALCACFALVGTFSFKLPRGGALVVPVPRDLVQFAALRPTLTPKRLADLTVGGVGDAALAVGLALRQAQLRSQAGPAIEGVYAYLLRSTAWASQQKSRVGSLEVEDFPLDLLARYEDLSSRLPARLVRVAAKKGQEAGSFWAPSALRAFLCDNLARGLPWYRGFSSARDFDRERFLHTPHEKDNKGALWPREKEALRTMTTTLEDPEAILVRAVHEALRRRLGAIADENQDNRQARENRWSRERERLRLAFAGAKTHPQVRFALADLFSRAGTVKELQERWTELLPMLREDRWQDARDLTLVALASYGSRGDSASHNESNSDLNPE